MAMNQNYTYNLTVTWGKFLMNVGEDSSPLDPPELKWCWHAVATIIKPYNSAYVLPTGWTLLNNDNNEVNSIECNAYTWSTMASFISNLSIFWDPSSYPNQGE